MVEGVLTYLASEDKSIFLAEKPIVFPYSLVIFPLTNEYG